MFGLRIQGHSLAFLRARLRDFAGEGGSDLRRMLQVFGPVVFIHLSRKDRLGQAISRVRAEQSGLWHMGLEGQAIEQIGSGKAPVYDGGRIAAVLEEIERQEEMWSDWFGSEGIEPLRLTYEALAAAPESILCQVLGFIGQDASLARSVRPDTVPLSDGMSAAWRARFLEEGAPGVTLRPRR